MKPHELARLIQEEAAKLVPNTQLLEDLFEELADLVEWDEVRRLIRQAQPPVNTLN